MNALGSYNPEPNLNSEGTWGMVSCALAPVRHGGGGRDANPSFAVSVGQGVSYGKCFSCGFQGGMLALVRDAKEHGLIDAERAEELSEYILAEEKRSLGKQVEGKDKGWTPPQLPHDLIENLGTPHKYWSEKRGFDIATQRAWNLGYSPEKQRALIPFYDYNGALVGIVGRDVTGESEQKYYIYPQGFDRAQYLFGENRVSGQEDSVLLVEGYLDAVSASRFLPPNIGVMALGSASPSPMQIRKLTLLAKEVILGLDQDSAGVLGTEKCKRLLGGKVRLTEIEYGDHKDADEAGPAIMELIQQRKNPLLHGLLDVLKPLTMRVT